MSLERLDVCPATGCEPACCRPQVNTAPYKEGWIIKLKISNKSDANKLMDAATYEKETAH